MKSSQVTIVPPSLRDAETWGHGDASMGHVERSPKFHGMLGSPAYGVCPKYQIYKKAKTQEILNLKHNRTFYA